MLVVDSRIFRVCWRTVVLLIYFSAMAYDVLVVEIRYDENLAPLRIFMQARLVYLTYFNMFIQIIFNVIAIFSEFSQSRLLPIRDYIFSVLAFPKSFFVTTGYWAIYAVNSELAFPKKAQEIVPSWVNHTLHTSTLIFVMIEMLLCSRTYPNRRVAAKGLAIFVLVYSLWVTFARLVSGIWIYPILNSLNWPLILLTILITYLCDLTLFLFGEFLNNKIWDDSRSKISNNNNNNKYAMADDENPAILEYF